MTMAIVGIGIILIYVLLAIIGFVVVVAVLRWAFGINKIVELLSDISNSLKMRKVASGQSPSAVAGHSEQPQPVHFGIGISELSTGDWIVNPEGQRYEVVGFKGKDLLIKQEGGTPMRISPPFNYRKE
jgi:hypothetical protein